MKASTLPLKNSIKSARQFLKRGQSFDKSLAAKERNRKRFRIVQSVTAGRVRGGHSFH
ncbi:MAG: hypothetical protein HY088_07970 [Ignavibacteriales bacterium]|nr:hypothetical protein [Ignavibacteriales bacterium]